MIPSSSPPANAKESPDASHETLVASVCPHCGQAVSHQLPADKPRAARTLQLASASDLRDAATVADAEPSAHTEPSAHPDPLTGMVVAGRYRMMECIGRGGMGLIYKVEHIELGKLLALKLLAGEFSRDRRVVRRFKREALLVSRLSHPNTVQVFDFGTHDNLTYLVMELVSGKDLAWIVKEQGPLPFRRVVPIIMQVCSSLAEAHAMGIVHRDVKLGNIMISPCCEQGNDLVKVLDFGLAKLRDAPELADVTGVGGVVGTPHYMAPEQIRGKQVDGRADIYSLGAVMYRCLTGEPVFKASSSAALFDQHLHTDPQPPHLRAPSLEIPESLSAIVVKALAKDPLDRYQRVEDLQEALIQLGVVGPPSLQVLLDASRLNALQRDSAEAQQAVSEAATAVNARKRAATRDEVAAYERKLKRGRWISLATAVGLAVVAAWGASRIYRYAHAVPAFNGSELEPNNSSREANELPFGRTVRGHIGQRIDPQRGDRDFFRLQVPDGQNIVALRASALPNMPLCTLIYETTEDELLARFCNGRPGVDLLAPSVRLAPGVYYVAVLQDRDLNHTSVVSPVIENVSDSYELSIGGTILPVSGSPAHEVEPNDSLQGADQLSPGKQLVGMPGWLDDVDFVCAVPAVASNSQPVRWVVADAIDRARDRGMVLEVTANHGAHPNTAVRVHRTNSEGVATAHDRIGPWTSEPFVLSPDARTQCVRLKLTIDPWVGADVPIEPLSGHELWSVQLEEAR